MLRQTMKKQEGSLTIEAMLALTTVFFSLTLVLLGFLLMYNKLVLMETAAAAAEQAVLLRRSDTGVAEAQALSPESLSVLEGRIMRSLGKGVIKPAHTAIRVRVDRQILSSTLKVTVTQEYRLPFGWIKAVFDGQERLTLTGTGEAALLEPVQYIRGVDLGLEYIQRLREGI